MPLCICRTKVDITMKAAKENEAVTAEQYARESIRIARTTRELLKRRQADIAKSIEDMKRYEKH